MTYNLIISTPDGDPVLYELNAERIGVGRSPENQIQIDVPEVSSSHFEVRKDGDSFEIIDLDSFNGTRVNGEKISEPTTLEDGDRLLIGETVGAHFLQLAEGEEPEMAAEKADASGQKSAATYVSLDEKIQELEASLNEKQAEFNKLSRSIDKLQSDIETLSKSGDANPGELDAMQDDLMKKTQRVEILKTDIAELEKTTKTALKPPAPSPKKAPTVRLNSLNKPGTPQKPPGPPAAPTAPAAAPPLAKPKLPPASPPKKPPSAG